MNSYIHLTMNKLNKVQYILCNEWFLLSNIGYRKRYCKIAVIIILKAIIIRMMHIKNIMS